MNKPTILLITLWAGVQSKPAVTSRVTVPLLHLVLIRSQSIHIQCWWLGRVDAWSNLMMTRVLFACPTMPLTRCWRCYQSAFTASMLIVSMNGFVPKLFAPFAELLPLGRSSNFSWWIYPDLIKLQCCHSFFMHRHIISNCICCCSLKESEGKDTGFFFSFLGCIKTDEDLFVAWLPWQLY